MLDQRLRRWSNFVKMLYTCLHVVLKGVAWEADVNFTPSQPVLWVVFVRYMHLTCINYGPWSPLCAHQDPLLAYTTTGSMWAQRLRRWANIKPAFGILHARRYMSGRVKVAIIIRHATRCDSSSDGFSWLCNFSGLGSHHLISRGVGGLKTNYLFQPGSAVHWIFQMLLHGYIEQFLK